jgi:beta-xylosidase
MKKPETLPLLLAGVVVELSPDGLKVVGEPKKLYDGWPYPKEWPGEGVFMESPKLFFHKGYYYLCVAQGGTSGPPTSHMLVAARSKSPLGPWENSPYNPIVHTYSIKEHWWSKGHGPVIEGPDGNWWVIYHAYENGYRTLGRQTLMEPVEWTDDGWFRIRREFSPTVRSRNPRGEKWWPEDWRFPMISRGRNWGSSGEAFTRMISPIAV